MLKTNISIRRVVTTIIRSLLSILVGKKKKDSSYPENVTPHGNERPNVVNGSKCLVTLTRESINSDQRQHQLEKLFWVLGRIEL